MLEDIDFVQIKIQNNDEDFAVIHIQFNYSLDSINRIKLLYGVTPKYNISFIINNVDAELLNQYLLKCFYTDEDFFIITYEIFYKIVCYITSNHNMDVDNNMFMILGLVRKNETSKNKVREYHHQRLQKMMDDVDNFS